MTLMPFMHRPEKSNDSQPPKLELPTPKPPSEIDAFVPKVYTGPEDKEKYHVIIDGRTQTGHLIFHNKVVDSFPISVGKEGVGSMRKDPAPNGEPNYSQTPSGLLQIAEDVIGKGFPAGTAIDHHKVEYKKGKPWVVPIEDKRVEGYEGSWITSRLFSLEGLEPQNSDTYERGFGLHGTSQEGRLGTPASHGCIRVSNSKIIELADKLGKGSKVYVVPQ